jgi:hypothetical protein
VNGLLQREHVFHEEATSKTRNANELEVTAKRKIISLMADAVKKISFLSALKTTNGLQHDAAGPGKVQSGLLSLAWNFG